MSAVVDAKRSAVAALKLQRERSTAYQQWTLQFHRAITGDITASELQRNIQGIVLPEFQRISTQLRTLQRTLEESASTRLSCGTTAGAGARVEVDNKRKSCGPPSEARALALASWIDRLQDLEREHYTVTLGLANQLVEHCTPNVCRATAEDGAAAATAPATSAQQQQHPSAATAVSTDIKDLFKPDDSDGDEEERGGDGAPLYERVDRRSRQTPAAPSAPVHAVAATGNKSSSAAVGEDGAASPVLRVHDADRCPLARLVPPRFHTHLFFVPCRNAIDELGGGGSGSSSRSVSTAGENAGGEGRGGGDAPSEADENKRTRPRESELVPLHAKRAARGDGVIARYDPAAVARRCLAWSSGVGAVVHQQEAIRAAIEDLCEELQGEISDDV